MSSVLDRIAHRAGQKNVRFTTLAHHLTPEFLESTWHGLNQRGAPGISGETMEAYGKARAERIPELVERLKRHAYRVPPVRRTYIPKAGNTQKMRPLGIPTVGSQCTSTQWGFGIRTVAKDVRFDLRA
jgi:retron-type reverse transcriptase